MMGGTDGTTFYFMISGIFNHKLNEGFAAARKPKNKSNPIGISAANVHQLSAVPGFLFVCLEPKLIKVLTSSAYQMVTD
ncbi:MAG: hypothetical protein WCF67_25475 [Chitinophagaceae bacterium]